MRNIHKAEEKETESWCQPGSTRAINYKCSSFWGPSHVVYITKFSVMNYVIKAISTLKLRLTLAFSKCFIASS